MKFLADLSRLQKEPVDFLQGVLTVILQVQWSSYSLPSSLVYRHPQFQNGDISRKALMCSDFSISHIDPVIFMVDHSETIQTWIKATSG